MTGRPVASRYFPERSYVRGQNQHDRLQFDCDSICRRSKMGILAFPSPSLGVVITNSFLSVFDHQTIQAPAPKVPPLLQYGKKGIRNFRFLCPRYIVRMEAPIHEYVGQEPDNGAFTRGA